MTFLCTLVVTMNLFPKQLINRFTGRHRSLVAAFAGFSSSGASLPAVSRMTVDQAVTLWTQHFQLNGVSEPDSSSRLIIAHVLGVKTLENLPHGRRLDVLTDAQTQAVWELCGKRLSRMPVQYVIEEWDFRDLTLKMKRPVFIPRPETEELVSLVLEDVQLRNIVGTGGTGLRCLEIGCGSGAIALSLLHSLPQLSVVALDQSQSAVSLTTENASRSGLHNRLEVYQLDVTKDGDVIAEKSGVVELLVSNPPYLLTRDMEHLEPEIHRFEDHTALDGGPDGLVVIGHILALASKVLSDRGRVYLEVDPQHPPLIQRWAEEKDLGLQYVQTHSDITNRPRFCVLQKLK